MRGIKRADHSVDCPVHYGGKRPDCLCELSMKPLKKHPKQQRLEDITFSMMKPAKKTKAMYQWDKALEESRQGLEDQRCKSCRVYPGSGHKENCSELLRIRTQAYKEYKRKSEVPHTREYLRPISDPHHRRHVFMVLVLIAALIIAVVVL